MKTALMFVFAILFTSVAMADPWFLENHAGHYRTVWHEEDGEVRDENASKILHVVPHEDVEGLFTLYVKDPGRSTEQATLRFTNVGTFGYGNQITLEDGGQKLLGLSRWRDGRWEILFRTDKGFRPIAFPTEHVTRDGDGARYIALQRMSSGAVAKFEEARRSRSKGTVAMLESR